MNFADESAQLVRLPNRGQGSCNQVIATRNKQAINSTAMNSNSNQTMNNIKIITQRVDQVTSNNNNSDNLKPIMGPYHRKEHKQEQTKPHSFDKFSPSTNFTSRPD